MRLTAAVGRATETILLQRRSRWELLHSSLSGLSPKAILARGYALVFDAAGNLVKERFATEARRHGARPTRPGGVHRRGEPDQSRV